MDTIKAATDRFENWLTTQTEIVRMDLIRKHERMSESPFVFLRGTFYRWIEQWPEVCASLADAPRILSVGDLHVENFGTWRDVEGRLVWGVNDVDEAGVMAYTNDLVRLATSARLAVRACHLRLPLRDICDALVDGYATSLTRGGRPIVIAERRRWLRAVAMSDQRDPQTFWTAMQALPVAGNRVPADALRAMEVVMPDPGVAYTVRRRTAGVGSLGRPRFVALATCKGGLIAREAKAYVTRTPGAAGQLIDHAVRAHDPFWAISGAWIVRRLAPDCSRIEIEDLPEKRNERKLLRAMGWEAANMHLATPRGCPAIRRDLRSRRPRWLERAASDMVDAVTADWRAWKSAQQGSPTAR